MDPRAAAGSAEGPWDCPECGKLFHSLQQVVVHARVHVHKGGEEGASGEMDRTSSSSRARESPGRPGTESQVRQAVAASFPSIMPGLKGQNGSVAVLSAVASLSSSRDRVRSRGIKDCPYCGKAFRSSHHLKVHLRVHTGERPYKCPHCDYAGTQSGSLKYHLQRHHREQRNLSGSAATSAGGLAAAVNGPTSVKQRRLQTDPKAQSDGLSCEASQQSWVLGLPQQHLTGQGGLASLRDIDPDAQYRYLSGVMGTFYPGSMEGAWIRESPPPKALKVSRRKPPTTNRMVPPCDKRTSASPGQAGAFEPLDLSRRSTPGLRGPEEDGGGERIKLKQCLDCPFRTSSTELMAMHLQVNHTTKSRRKITCLSAFDDKDKDLAPKGAGSWHQPDSLDWIWGYTRESQAGAREGSSNQMWTPNGLPPDHCGDTRATSPALQSDLGGDDDEECSSDPEDQHKRNDLAD